MALCLICQYPIEEGKSASLENEGTSHNLLCKGIFCAPCLNIWSEQSRQCPLCRQTFTRIKSLSFDKYIDPEKPLHIEPEPYSEQELLFLALDHDEQLRQELPKREWFLHAEDADTFLEDVLTSLSFLSLEEKINVGKRLTVVWSTKKPVNLLTDS